MVQHVLTLGSAVLHGLSLVGGAQSADSALTRFVLALASPKTDCMRISGQTNFKYVLGTTAAFDVPAVRLYISSFRV